MSIIDHKNIKLQYRHYTIEPDLPLLYFSDANRPSNPLYSLNDGCEVRYMHMHNCIEIACIEENGGEICLDSQIQQLQKGDVVVIMPYRAHILRERHAGPYAAYFYFDPYMFLRSFQPEAISASAIFGGKSSPACTILQNEGAGRIRRRVSEIIDEMKADQINSRLCAKGLLLSLSVELSRALGQQLPLEKRGGSATSIMPALQYINENFQESISMEQLQTMCHLSGTHFRRLFGSVMGCSPLEYIQNLRISRACDLLLSGSGSILSISLSVGYDSISSFNRQFIKIVGMPPSQWRKERLHMKPDTEPFRSVP